MTREHKLALIIGFAILLVVGVLVGDHFSKARHTLPGTEVATATRDTIGIQGDPATAINEPRPPAVVGPAATLPAANAVQPEAQPAPTQPTLAVPAGPKTISMTGTSSENTPVNTPANSPDAPRFVFIPEGTPPATTVTTVRPGESTPTVVTTTGTPGTASAGLPVSKGKLTAYPVARGDTLASLARKFYNDPALSKKLGEYNKSRLGANLSLREGVTLRVPPKDVLLGQAQLAPDAIVAPGRGTPAPAPEAGRPASENVSPKPEPAVAPAKEYTVQKGDSLGTIAQKTLGSSKRADEILQLNRGVISDRDSIRVGMKLKIPAR